jgi:ribonuclease HI
MTYTCYSDGGYDNVRKRNGYGSFAMINDSRQNEIVHFKLDHVHSSNEAEFETLFYLLCEIYNFPVNDKFIIYIDSKLVYDIISGNKLPQKENIKVFASKIVKLYSILSNQLELHWVPREKIVAVLGH